jgi:hypothetical protein
METTIVAPTVGQSAQPAPAKTPIKTAWQTDIRSPSPASSDGKGELNGYEDAHETGWKKDRLWFEVSHLDFLSTGHEPCVCLTFTTTSSIYLAERISQKCKSTRSP